MKWSGFLEGQAEENCGHFLIASIYSPLSGRGSREKRVGRHCSLPPFAHPLPFSGGRSAIEVVA